MHPPLPDPLIAGAISRFAGTGTAGFSGDAGPASAAALNRPQGLCFAPAGAESRISGSVTPRLQGCIR